MTGVIVDSFTRKKIVLTGGAGFLGNFVLAQLNKLGAGSIFVVRKRIYDLCLQRDVARLYSEERPDILIHLAATVGGIGANRLNPGRFFYENMVMGLNVIEEARRYGGLEKLVIVGTTCSYPKHTPTPFREEELWNGYPEETNAPYGIAKKALLVMAHGYRQQYGLRTVYVIPANLYGPGDNFHPETSHVIPALIRKFLEAKDRGLPCVEVWGTGNVSREFLYVEDAAEGIGLVTARYEGVDPVNLGTGKEILIRDLVKQIQDITQYSGEVVWNTSQPDGQPRRRLDVSRARTEFGFSARTDVRSGLEKTIAWYRAFRLQRVAEQANA